jgi:hypothetical protein
MVTAEDVRAIASPLPRAYEVLVRDRVKFRVGSLVFLSLSPDETQLGFGYPKEERAALIATEPDKFLLPLPSDMRFNWMRVWLAAIDIDELQEIIISSWRMSVPKKVSAEYEASRAAQRRGYRLSADLETARIIRPARIDCSDHRNGSGQITGRL